MSMRSQKMSNRPEVRLPAFLSRLKYNNTNTCNTCHMHHVCHHSMNYEPHTCQEQEQRRHILERGNIYAPPTFINGVYEVNQVQYQ